LPGDASSETMRAAAQEVLAKQSYRDNAKRRSAMLACADGAASAADEVESLLASAKEQNGVRSQQVARSARAATG
jgi:UDP:flavonoid glycosyltransferase YjiC (YdhE family)